MKSLFLRMRSIHWVAVIALAANIVFFTDQSLSIAVQAFLLLAVIVHDIDEKRWGVDTLDTLNQYLNRIKDKNLTIENHVDTRYNAELTHVVSSVEAFVTEIRLAIRKMNIGSATNLETANDVNRLCSDMHTLISTSANNADRINIAVDQIGSVSKELSSNTDYINEQLKTVDDDVNLILNSAKKLDSEMSNYTHQCTNLASQMDQLSKSTSQVQGILKTVDEIAEQTNLLALNASIEAARAGELGRGFAVVAEEVRALAGRTKNSLSEIDSITSDIVSEVKSANQIMEQQNTTLSEVVNLTGGVNNAIDTMSSSVRHSTERMQSVASLSGDVDSRVQEISTLILAMKESEHSNLQALDSMAELSSSSRQDAERMQLLLNDFKV